MENRNFKLISASLRELVTYQWQKEINPSKCIYLVISSVIQDTLDGSLDDVYTLASAVPSATVLHRKASSMTTYKSLYMSQLEQAAKTASLAVIIKKAILEEKDLILVCADGNEEGIDYLSVVREYIEVRYKVRTASISEMMKDTPWARERMREGKIVPDYTGNTYAECQEIVALCTDNLIRLDSSSINLLDQINRSLNDHRIAIATLEEKRRKKKERKKMKKKLKHMSPSEAYGWSYHTVGEYGTSDDSNDDTDNFDPMTFYDDYRDEDMTTDGILSVFDY